MRATMCDFIEQIQVIRYSCGFAQIQVMLQNLETALAWELGQMSLVNDYQTFWPNLVSSSVVVKYRAWWLIYQYGEGQLDDSGREAKSVDGHVTHGWCSE